MRHQIRRQAPPGAVGYRLVLPLRGEDMPHILPLSATPGAPTAWRLEPFEPPDDLRLKDGKVYRLLFVDERGTILSPQKKYIPALRFFLGPPTPLAARRQREFVEVLDRIEDPQIRDEAAEQILAMRFAQTRSREQERHAARLAHEQAEQAAQQAAAIQKQTETLLEHRRQQAREEADRARAEAAASRARMPWVLGSVTLGAALLGVLAAWLGPKLAARFKSLPSGQAGDLTGRIFEDARQMMARVQVAAQGAGAPSPPAVPAVEAAERQPLAVPASSVEPAAPSERTEPSSPPHPVPSRASESGPSQPETAPATPAQPGHPASCLPREPAIQAQEATNLEAPAPAADNAAEREPAAPGAADSATSEPSALSAAAFGLTDREWENLALLACDQDKSLYVSYEYNKAVRRAQQQPEPPPPPGLLFSESERKELARLAADPQGVSALLHLQQELHELLLQNPERATSLPPPFRSLLPGEARRIQAVVRDLEQRRYLAYAIQHRAARLQGKPLPSEPATSLSSEVRRQIRRLPVDARCYPYVLSLLEAANQT